jgi:methylthioribose-1-phosphate isomerase
VDGASIPIEERDPDEVRKVGEVWLTLPAVRVANPAFDVTPHRYVSGIITDRGIAHPPYSESLLRLAADATSF